MFAEKLRRRPEAAELVPVAGRVPPHDLDAEAAVLSAVLLSAEAFDQVQEILAPEHFYSEANRRIYEGVLDLSTASRPVDIVTVAGWLRDRERLQQIGGPPYLAQLADATPAVAHVEHHAKAIREKWRVRQLIATCQRFAAEGYSDYGEVQGFIDQAEQAVFDIARIPEGTSIVSVKDAIHGAFQILAEAAKRGGSITGIPTGFVQLDKKCAGLHSGDLYIVAGRPGMGKTSFVLNLAVNVAQPRRQEVADPSDPYAEAGIEEPGFGVAFFSLEMPREQLASRLLAVEARVDVSRIRSGDMRREDWNKLTDAAARLGRLPIWLDDTPALTLLDLRAKVRRLQAELKRGSDAAAPAQKLGLVVIDYLQLMQGRRDAGSREQEISELSRGLKQLSKEFGVPVMALSQLNRSVETRTSKDKRPQLSDLRECVSGDTLVVLADGTRVPIAELVGTTPVVVSMSEHGRLVTAASDKVWRVGKRPVFQVELASGRTLRATGKHRLYGASGWCRVGDLAIGDRIACARALPQPSVSERWPEHRVALLGHLIGDGSYPKHQPLRYTTASHECSALVRAAAEEMGCRVTRVEGRGNWQLVISGNGNRSHPSGVGAWLAELGILGQCSRDKRVPSAAFRLHGDQIALLVRHLWATDGTITPRRDGSAITIAFSTCSEGLARDVVALLLRLSVVARIHRVAQPTGSMLFNVTVLGADAQRRFLERVGTFGPRTVGATRAREILSRTIANTNLDTLPREQGITTALCGTANGKTSHFRFAPSRAVVAEHAKLLHDDQLAAQTANDLFWDRVVSIEPAGEEDVYDLTVPGPASWLADGVVSHNSGAIEQDADTIVFIYRDEYYFKDSPDKGIAELIIAKQRNGPTGSVKVKFTSEFTRFDNLAPGEYEFDEFDDFGA